MKNQKQFNYKLILEYDGSFFAGWQRQKGFATVQQCLEEALLKVTKVACVTHGSGRTDRGVHATGQVAHVIFNTDFSLDRLRRGGNFYLHDVPLRILSVEKMPFDFHARFSALKRHYCYRLLNRPSPSPLRHQRVWWVPKKLDLAAMQEAASFFVGHHDFSAFRDAACQATSPLKTMDMCQFFEENDELHLKLSARSFLHHQVRIMVGTLVKVGQGVWPASYVTQLLKAKVRSQSGPTAPPGGLYLTQVDYR
ncbi:MAG: tRNA pseudouridine(38-40) synthase TruA [Holosporaceae bacterium]